MVWNGKQFRRTWDFTLVELLVLLGIIIIPAVTLLPGFSQAKNEVTEASCLGNLKEIGLAINLYLADNQGWYPCTRNPEKKYWFTLLVEGKYLKDPEALLCSVLRNRPAQVGATSYIPNGFLVRPVDTPQKYRNRNDVIPRWPADKLVLASDKADNLDVNVPAWNIPDHIGFYHEGERANILWCDGHVSSLARSETRGSNWIPEWGLWSQ